jgi:hypothetical protein
MSSAPESVFEDRNAFNASGSKAHSPSFSWQTSGLNLEALHNLASSLNPADQELTPVQAWFELAAHYHHSILLDRVVLECLKLEFVGVVKCVRYGAAIERKAFESIIGRVLG